MVLDDVDDGDDGIPGGSSAARSTEFCRSVRDDAAVLVTVVVVVVVVGATAAIVVSAVGIVVVVVVVVIAVVVVVVVGNENSLAIDDNVGSNGNDPAGSNAGRMLGSRGSGSLVPLYSNARRIGLAVESLIGFGRRR